jgi:hypothetical protein
MSLEQRLAGYIASRDAAANLGGTNYGSMCEVMLDRRYTSARCGRCDGMGCREVPPDELDRREKQIGAASDVIDPGCHSSARDQIRAKLAKDSLCPACKGTGMIESLLDNREWDTTWTTIRCRPCKGSGRSLRRSTTASVSNSDVLSLLGLDDVCTACRGDGYVVPVTVKETGCSKKGKPPPKSAVDLNDTDAWSGGSTAIPSSPTEYMATSVNEERVRELGAMSNLLVRIKRTDARSATVLEAFYGPAGDKFGQHRWGRSFAVWPLTHSGGRLAAELADRSKLGSGHLISALDRLETERERSERIGTPQSRDDVRARRFLDCAAREAKRLLDQAQRVLRLAGAN